MLLLSLLTACTAPPTGPICGDFLPMQRTGRQFDYDPGPGVDEELYLGGPWDAGEERSGFAVTWELFDGPDPPEVEDPDPSGEIMDFAWTISCGIDGSVWVHDYAGSGETWEGADGEHTPWMREESFDPPTVVWLGPDERAAGWSGSTSVSCIDDNGDCSETREYAVTVSDGASVRVGAVDYTPTLLSADVFPWAPFESIEMIPGVAIWSFTMLEDRYWVLDNVHDPS